MTSQNLKKCPDSWIPDLENLIAFKNIRLIGASNFQSKLKIHIKKTMVVYEKYLWSFVIHKFLYQRKD